MSLTDRLDLCRRWDPGAYRGFVVAGREMGRIRHDNAEQLSAFPGLFEVGPEAVVMDPTLTDFEARSRALRPVVRRLHDERRFAGWRDEPYPVMQQWGEEPVMEIERAAVPFFGLRGYGVHLNGFVEAPEGLKLWVGKRALTKPTGPGKLDHLAAGGQPHGIGLRENMIKECGEEAGMSRELAEGAEAAGAITYVCERPEGLRDDILFCFDLALPASFVPRNEDGEVEAFYLWPIEEVVARLRETEDFKFNCALVIIDFLLRRGLLASDEPAGRQIVDDFRVPVGEVV